MFPNPLGRPLEVDAGSVPPRSPSRSAELFRSLFERSGVCIASLDPELKVRRVNANLLAVLGSDATQVEGHEFVDVMRTGATAELQARFEDLRTSRYDRFTERVVVRRPDGIEVVGTLTAVPVRGASQVVAAVLVVLLVDAEHAPLGPARARGKLLSNVDARVLEGVAAGVSTVQLAAQLYLSRQGVEYHVASMLRRLKVPNRPALVSRAYTMGILSAGTWPPRVRQNYLN
jgi:PAS domain S-box-containing protein